jgi:hypothetical protein
MSERRTWTPDAPASAGGEFEMDMIAPSGRMFGSESDYNAGPYATGWSMQSDGTAGYEHRTPVWNSVRQGAESIKRMYAQWIPAHNGTVPLFQNGHRLHSCGHHIHVGKGRHTYLDRTEIEAIFKHFRLINPLIGAISASPLPSERGLHNTFCYSITSRSNRYGVNDHHIEYNSSEENGTFETRLPDPNIPQAMLTNMYLLTHISEHARENCHCSMTELRFDPTEYLTQRTQGLTHGMVGLPIGQLLRKCRTFLGDFSNNLEIPAVRDILFMAAKYYSSPHQIFTMLQPSTYEYFKAMVLEPSEYLSNLASITTGEGRVRVESWINEANSITTIDQLIALAEAGLAGVQARMQVPIIVATAVFNLARSEAVRSMQERTFNVVRIMDTGLPVETVRAKIAYLLTRQGDGFTNPITAEQVAQLNCRFYVLTMPMPRTNNREIVACIAINVGERARREHKSEVGHLAVHRMYRRLNIAKILVNHVKNIALENSIQEMHTHIKVGNTASEQLFQSAGYILAPTPTPAEDEEEPESRKWILNLLPVPQVQIPPPNPPDSGSIFQRGPTTGAFTEPVSRGQTTLEDLVRQMREDEERARTQEEHE